MLDIAFSGWVKRFAILAFLCVTPVAGAAQPSHVLVTGDYHSNWEDVQLVQRGDRVTGTYVCCGGGTIDGRIIDGKILRYRWSSPGGGGGLGVWTISATRLDGTWGAGRDDHDGGHWDLTRSSASIAN